MERTPLVNGGRHVVVSAAEILAVTDHQPPRPPTPTVVCRLCGEGIWTAEELVLAGLGAAHAACLERSDADDLTHVGRSRASEAAGV